LEQRNPRKQGDANRTAGSAAHGWAPHDGIGGNVATALESSEFARGTSSRRTVTHQKPQVNTFPATCLAFAIIDGVLNGVNDAVSIAGGNNGYAQLDRVTRCSEQLDHKVRAIPPDPDSLDPGGRGSSRRRRGVGGPATNRYGEGPE